MSFLDRVKGLFGVAWGGGGAPTYQTAFDWVHGIFPDQNPNALTDPYASSATIATAISLIASDAASVEWELYPEGDSEDEIEDHPLLDLWDRPNEYMVGKQLWIGTYVSRKLWGEAFWYYPDARLGTQGGLRASNGPKGTLELLDPRGVVCEYKSGKLNWSIRVQGQDVALDETRLTQFKRYNPYNPFRGLSELASVLVEAEGDYAAARWNRNFFSDQNGVPAGILKPATGVALSPEQRREITIQWNQAHAKLKRSVGLLPAGWEWQDLGVNQKEMDFRSLREYSREQILSVFGVPPFYAGVMDKANYANAREQKDVYWNGTITRFLAEIQDVLNQDFLPKMGVEGIECYPCWEKVKALTENLNEKVDIAGKLFAMGFTKRQINDRLELGFDPDELEDADTGYISAGLVPVEFALNPPEPAPMPTDPAQANQDEPTDQAATDSGTKRITGDPSLREAVRSLRWRRLQRATRDIEFAFNRVVRSNFKSIESQALDNVTGMKGWMIENGVIKAESSPLFDVQASKKKLRKQTEPLYYQAIVRGGDSIMDEIQVGISFDATMPGVEWRLGDLLVKNGRIVETVEKQLRDSMQEGLGQGESPQQIASRIRSVMNASEARSMTIARTETGYAFTTGRHEGMKQGGVRKKEWLSAKDDRVRPDHQALDGQVVDIDDQFRVERADGSGLLNIAYPLDPSAPADEVINCRCTFLPVVADVSEVEMP